MEESVGEKIKEGGKMGSKEIGGGNLDFMKVQGGDLDFAGCFFDLRIRKLLGFGFHGLQLDAVEKLVRVSIQSHRIKS